MYSNSIYPEKVYLLTIIVMLADISVILETYQWLVCWLAEKAVRDYQKQVEQGKDNFTARNHSQLYSATSLAIAYGEVSNNWECTLVVKSCKKVEIKYFIKS